MQRAILMSCLTTALCGISFQIVAQTAADTFPSKVVTLVVPYAPGGAAEKEARIYAGKLTGFYNQPFVLDLKPGGGTTIATAYVAKSAPDGYTLLAVPSGMAIFPSLYKDLPFDTIKDFAPITQMSRRISVLIVPPSFPAKTFQEYIAYARANPGKVNYGTSGSGDIVHLTGAWMHSATGTKATFFHYKGTGALLPDLISGRITATASGLAVLPLINAGKLRALAVTNENRSKLLPEVPTIAEQGLPGFDSVVWQGYSAPAATPAPVVNKLNEGFVRVARSPDVVAALEADGAVMVGNTPAQFRQIIISETARWKKLIQETGIELDQ